jgi:hypothetical protein
VRHVQGVPSSPARKSAVRAWFRDVVEPYLAAKGPAQLSLKATLAELGIDRDEIYGAHGVKIVEPADIWAKLRHSGLVDGWDRIRTPKQRAERPHWKY